MQGSYGQGSAIIYAGRLNYNSRVDTPSAPPRFYLGIFLRLTLLSRPYS